MKARVIIQARTDSRRLPGKSLLPVTGFPLAVLAARRAGSKGHRLVLATSDRSIDDELARLALTNGVPVVRGPAEDVRRRILMACGDADDDELIVRLTADNVFPDGDLVTEMLADFCARRPLISAAGGRRSRLPYGVSAEVLAFGTLRQSLTWRDYAGAREHVTGPVLDREPEPTALIAPPLGDISHLRCTVDTFDDYMRILKVFEHVDDPCSVSWRELVVILAGLSDAPTRLAPGPGLAIGTAQLTVPYGSATKTRPPSAAQATRMLHKAVTHGAIIDTARAYGSSERIIGDALKGGWMDQTHVVTKLDPLVRLQATAPVEIARSAAELSVLRSLLDLRLDSPPTLLLHRPEHRKAWDGIVWQLLRDYRSHGLLARLGVSVVRPTDLIEALDDPSVKVFQIPNNILDHRWDDKQVTEAISNRPDVEIHVRSAFLQGVLLRGPEAWPTIPGCNPRALTDALDRLAAELGRMDRTDLCLGWLRGEPLRMHRFDRVVVGMETEAQLEANLRYWSQRGLMADEMQYCRDVLPRVPERLLDPALW